MESVKQACCFWI